MLDPALLRWCSDPSVLPLKPLVVTMAGSILRFLTCVSCAYAFTPGATRVSFAVLSSLASILQELYVISLVQFCYVILSQYSRTELRTVLNTKWSLP